MSALDTTTGSFVGPTSTSGTSSGGTGSSADWGSLLSGLYGLYQNNQNNSTLSNGNAFNSYRPGYADQLSKLIANPSSVTNDAGFKAGLNQSQDQVQHRLASQGLVGGGTMAGTLSNTAAEYTGTYLNNQETMLANLAGAWINPNQTYASQTSSASSNQSGLNSTLNGLIGLYGSYMNSGGGG